MKYHKIRNIPLDVCTIEQVVAYNISFRADINFGKRFAEALKISETTARDFVAEIIRREVEYFPKMDNYSPKKFNIDAIFCALNAGMFEYMKSPFIANDYKQVGEAFPAEYLKTA